jgi:ATP-dependent DNA helicase RecQ
MDIHQILKQYWGYENFRPLQEEIISSVLENKDILALLPTGGGKSICFQIPALAKSGITIVISPLIALMKDQVDNLQKKGINALAIISGMGKREIDIALDNCIYGPVKFLYISPERLQTDLVKERIKYMKVNLFAIDEAHCISQWGYDFRPSYLHIKELRVAHPDVPFLALTASATHKVQQDIISKLDFKESNIYRKSFERKNLSYAVLNLENKLQKLLQIANNIKGSGIVYVRTRKDTVEIAKFFNQNRISASYYHAGLESDIRNKTQQHWIENKIKIIVATNAFGMGIDKPDVRFVVHYEMPESLEAYYQEAGRGGRDEQKAYAVLLYQQLDKVLFEKKFQQNFPSINEIRKTYHFLCNYLQIAIGSGEGVSHDFNIGDFCSKFQLEVIPTISAIKTLEHHEYITLSENALLPSRIQFLAQGEDLYKFQVEHAKFDFFIKIILRLYGGAFDQFISIKETEIAQKNNMNKSQVISLLGELHQLEIISYVKKTDQPILNFIKPRYKTEELYIDHIYYEERKSIYQNKMNAMLNYVNSGTCRSVSLLNYFDEKDALDCGVCDICIDKKKSNSLKEDIAKEILAILKFQSYDLEQLLQNISHGSENEKLDVVRQLLDSGDIKKIGEVYHLCKL